MEKAFLSHSSKDKGYVDVIAQKFGKDLCVYDSMCFEEGIKNIDAIFDGIEKTSIFVFFISNTSLDSEWVQRELTEAEDRLHHDSSKLSQIFPIIIDPSIQHDDPRIPDFLKVGADSYNLRTLPNPSIAYRKIKAQLIKRKLMNADFRRTYQLFYGRDDEIAQFKRRFDGDYQLRVLVASGIFGIGRRSYLIEALRSAQVIERYYEPASISLGDMDGIDDLLARLYEAGFGSLSLEQIVSLKTMQEKIAALTTAFQDVQKYKEHIIIHDGGCIVGVNGELRYWFEHAVASDLLRPEIFVSIASRNSIKHMYERKHNWLFSIDLTVLPRPQWNGLLRVYSKSIGIEISAEDREYFKDVITGYPPQVLYCADLAKSEGIDYVKNHTIELVSKVSDSATKILGVALNSSEDSVLGYGLLSFISAYGYVPTNVIQKVFEKNEKYRDMFFRFRTLTICRYIGSSQEYIEVNPVICDYIQRNNFPLPQDLTDVLQNELASFQANVGSSVSTDDFESVRFYLKETLKAGGEVPIRFLYSTLYLQSIFDLYNSEKYPQVIEITSTLKESGTFERYDSEVQRRIQSYFCRALARQLDDKFYSEVNFFKHGAQADFRDQVEYDFLNGFMYRNRGQYDKARQRYLAVLQRRPNHASAMREIVSALRGMEDYESAYSYAKKNYERDSENPYHIQSYFDILIRRFPKLSDSEKEQLEEMRITIERINSSKPLNAYYEIEALYAMYIEDDKEKTVAILKNGCKSFPGSFYIVRLLFDCYDHFGDIGGMEGKIVSP